MGAVVARAMRGRILPARRGAGRVLAGALALLAAGAARPGPARADDDLASRFVTAPERAPDQRQLVDIEVNGLSFGTRLVQVSDGRVTLPAETVAALPIANRPGQPLALGPASGIESRFDQAASRLSLVVPVARLSSQRFAPEVDAAGVRLSPETWGAYVDYDANVRHEFGQGAGSFVVAGAGPRRPGAAEFGGLADLRVLAPDVVGGSAWAYDSTRAGPDALVRLDSALTWRPGRLGLAVSGGDLVSTTTASLAQARPYRFGGLQIGTDHSGVPGFSSSPIPSVTGSAQAQSAIDVYLDGQRTYHTSTAGGAFSLVLPPGSAGVGTNVVVTDVTGRSVVIPVEVARADAQLLRRGLFLWSAGLGSPRFAYGSASTRYDGKLYGTANGRYGVLDAATATLHAEAGPGLAEAEAGGDVSVTPWLAAHASLSASRAARGAGGAARLSLVAAGPWGLGLEVSGARATSRFEDVVAASGRDDARRERLDPLLSLPATSEVSARLSWRPGARSAVSASYQSDRYPGFAPVGFASVSANYLVGGRIPVFANLSHAMGGQHETALVAGVSLSFGGVQASVSGGYGVGGGAGAQGATGGVTASRPLGEAIGSAGWDAYGTRSPAGTFATADAQLRTGYGIPGVAVQSFGREVTTYATLRGTAGVLDLHPFVADPVSGGIIVADAGRAGVPVQLNGYDRGRTSFDGKIALAGAVAGAPQRVAIDTARLPIDAVPGETERLVTVRDRGATVAAFGVRSAGEAATLVITLAGRAPPVGSVVSSATSSAPVSKEGRAYLPSLARDEVVTVEMADGARCRVRTRFDGRGGVARRIGPFACEMVH